MEFFLILFAFIGFNVVAALAKKKSGDGGGAPAQPQDSAKRPRAGAAGKYASVSRRAAMARDFDEPADIEAAREFVERLKRRNAAGGAQAQAAPEPEACRVPEAALKPEAAPQSVPRRVAEASRPAVKPAPQARPARSMRADSDKAARPFPSPGVLRPFPSPEAPAEVSADFAEFTRKFPGPAHSTALEAAPTRAAFFAGKRDLRRAFVAAEILSKPVALRKWKI